MLMGSELSVADPEKVLGMLGDGTADLYLLLFRIYLFLEPISAL